VPGFPPGLWPFLAWVLIASSAFNGALGKVLGLFSIRPDWCLAAVATLLLLSAVPWTSAAAWRHRLRNPIAIALVVFVAVHVAASVLNAGRWPSALKFMNVYVLGLGVFLAVCQGLRSRQSFEMAVRTLVGVGVIASGWAGLAAIISNVAQRKVAGAQPILYQDGLAVYAGQAGLLEPNILGSFLLVPFALALWHWTDEAPSRFPFRAAALAIVSGLVASQTRAAWLCSAAIFLMWLWHRRPRLTAVIAVIGVAGLSVLVLQASLWVNGSETPISKLLPSTIKPPWMKDGGTSTSVIHLRAIDPVVRGRDYNLRVRWLINEAVLNSWRGSGPAGWLLGRGSGSTNEIEFVLDIDGTQTRLRQMWTGNAFIFNLHDAGIVGLAAFTALAAAVAYQLRRMLRRARRGREQGLCHAFIISALALLFAYQFTHALWQMSTYVFLGLVVVAARLLEAAAPPIES
jgi:hypothetical protein